MLRSHKGDRLLFTDPVVIHLGLYIEESTTWLGKS